MKIFVLENFEDELTENMITFVRRKNGQNRERDTQKPDWKTRSRE